MTTPPGTPLGTRTTLGRRCEFSPPSGRAATGSPAGLRLAEDDSRSDSRRQLGPRLENELAKVLSQGKDLVNLAAEGVRFFGATRAGMSRRAFWGTHRRDHLATTGHREILPTTEARAKLSQIAAEFERNGVSADPVTFGSHRRPQGVIIAWELWLEILPAIEDHLDAAEARQRLDAAGDKRVSFEEAAKALKRNPRRYR